MRKMTRRNGLRVAGEGDGGRARYLEGDVKGPCTNLQCRFKRGRSDGNHNYVCVVVGIFQSSFHVLCLVSVDIEKRDRNFLSDVRL